MSFQSKSVTLALSLAVLAALPGCDKLPGAAKPPAEAARPVAPAAPAAAPEPAPASPHPELVDGRKHEAGLLKALGQVEARQGQTLTLRRQGEVVLAKTDDAGAFYLLSDVIRMPTVNGVRTVYALAIYSKEESAHQDGPFTEFYDEGGNLIESQGGHGTWRGAVLAISLAEETWDVDDDGRVGAQLLDWSSKPHRKFDFKSRCQPMDWVSDTEIKGACTRPARQEDNPGAQLTSYGEMTDAVFTRVGPNAWRVRELSAPKLKLRDLPDNPQTAYDETVEGVPYSGNP